MPTVEILAGPKKQPKQQRSRDMVRAILDATAKVLVEDGYTAASTNRIAEVAGVSVGSLYQYFPNKESLVLTLALEHGEEQIGFLVRELVDVADLPPRDAIDRYVRANIAAHLEAPELHVHLTAQVLAHGLASMQTLQGQARLLVRGYLAGLGDSIDVADLDVASWLLVTTVEAAIHGAIIDDAVRLEDPAFCEELVELVCRYLRL